PVMAPHDAESFVAFVNQCFTVSATDAENDPFTFSLTSTPPLQPGATFDTSTGEFCWNAPEGGSHVLTVCATDNFENISNPCVTLTLTVPATNQPPVANPGGPYFGTAGKPIFFDGSGSSDPDAGQTLTYAWILGDGGASSEQNPVHAYGFAGTY